MASANATRSQALRVLGRSRLDGLVNHKSASPAQLTASQNDYQLPANNSGRFVVRLSSDASRNITGFNVALANAQTGDTVRLINVGSFDIVLTHQDVASAASNRMILPGALPHIMGPGDSVTLWHDDVTDRWRVVVKPDLKVLDGFQQTSTGSSTTSATLVNITGTSFTLTTTRTGKIHADMAFSANTTGGSPADAAWAISINSVDGTEMPRRLSGTNDTGIGSVMARSASLPPGTYTIVGRHRRVTGTSTVNTNVAQVQAEFFAD